MKRTIVATIALGVGFVLGSFAEDTNALANAHVQKATVLKRHVARASWYGTGTNVTFGYFNPARSGQYNPYPYYNIVGGAASGPLYKPGLPDQNESPFNPQAALARHRLPTARAANPFGSSNQIAAAAGAAPEHKVQVKPQALAEGSNPATK